MEPSVNVFWLPKEGNTAEEYEDASAHSLPKRVFAVADGATESSFADLWALSLVNKFIEAPPAIKPPATDPFREWVTPLQQEWHAQINWERLPWFAEEKARGGAFATFLGLKFSGGGAQEPLGFFGRLFGRGKSNEIRYTALAIGDSNLFHIRGETLLKAFPFTTSEQFNSRPLLLGSNPARNSQVWADIKFAEGDCQIGDSFILATDALAKWFCAQVEMGQKPWTILTGLNTDEEFAGFVGRLRKKSAIRNDDTTLVVCRWRETQAQPTES